MRRTKIRWTPAVILLSLLTPLQTNVLAETPEQKGLAIAKEIDRRDTGFNDFQANMRMVLQNRHGQHSDRSMRTKTLEGVGDGDKSIIVFDKPKDVEGTALLTYTHKEGPDDQWLYLPALKRVKRIASTNKSGPFVGSEYAYEDLASQEVEKYTYKYIGDGEFEGKACFKVERDPVDEYSGYTVQHAWIDKERYIPMKIDFYDRKESLLKTLEFRDYKQYLDQFWRAGKMHMKNHQTGKETTLFWENYEFRVGLTESDFNRNSLKRAR